MGAERTQKGAVGQQLAASGKARRAEKIRRDEKGNIGKDVARGVMEDRMSMNDKEGKQKQGKSGRPGKPIDGRPPMMGPLPPKKEGMVEDYMPPIDVGVKPFPPKEGRPFEPPKETYDPPRGDRPPVPMPPKPPRDTGGRPFPGFPGRPPGEGSLPGRPPFKGPRRGGTDFVPGRGDRLPEEAGRTEDTYFNRDRFNEAKDMLNQPGGEKMLKEFMEKLRMGGIR